MIFEMDRIPLLDTPRRFIGLGVPDDNISIDADRIVECYLRKRVVCHRSTMFLLLRGVVQMEEDDDTFERICRSKGVV